MKFKALLLTLASFTGAIQVDAALVAHYTLDDATTNAADSAGSNTGTFIGTPTAVSGLFGNAYSFNGSSGVNLGSSLDVRPTGDFTVTFWMNQSVSNNNVLLVGASDTIANAGAGWVVKPQNGGRVFFNTAATSNLDGTDRIVEGSNDIDATTANWHFMAARYTQSTGIFAYTVLTLTPTSSATNTAGITAATNSFDDTDGNVLAYGATAPPALIGSLSSGASGFIGLIDEVRYYNTPLADSELVGLYNAAIPEPSVALLGALGLLGLLRRRRA